MPPAARPAPGTHRVHRTCPLCEAHCGIAVEVDRRTGGVITIRGDRQDVMSRGFLCPKAYGLKGLLEDPDRLRRPLRRKGVDFEEIGWEEALELATSRLRAVRDAHGADAIATYLGNPTAHDFAAGLLVPVFLRALGTRWRFSASSVDQLPKMISSCLLFGAPLAIPVPDLDRTDFLLVLGANPVVSNGSLLTAPDMPGRLRKLRERGGRLVVVDPRRSETAALADRHLFLRPGSDAFLLFAMVHVLFAEERVSLGRLAPFTRGVEELRELAAPFSPEAVAPVCGVAAGEIRSLARDFANAPRAACYGRIGTCTQAFGTLASWLVDALNALTGNLDREGGAMFPLPAHAPAEAGRGRRGRVPYGRWRSRVRGLPEFAGELPVATLAEEIDTPGEGRVRALVTLAGNPVLSTPNAARLARAFSELEFMVSIDLYLNETTRHADLILPTSTPLERVNYDLVFHGLSVHNHAKWSPAAVEPPPDARDTGQLLLDLAARLSGTSPEALGELVLGGLLPAAVGPGTACPDLTPEEARSRLSGEGVPERMLDLMLRAGPYGDRFDDAASGLSLAKLQAAEHGVDLGPLRPRLPEMLRTASGAIELAPELLAGDVARLRDALAERRDARTFVLIGRRQLRSNNSWMHNVHALAKGRERCTLLVSEADAARLSLASGDRARLRSRVGELEAPVEVTPDLMPGVVSLPHGFGHDAAGTRMRVAAAKPGVNANLLADELLLDALSGNAVLNGIPVELLPAAPGAA